MFKQVIRTAVILGIASLCVSVAPCLNAQTQPAASPTMLPGQQKLADCNFQSSVPVSIGIGKMKTDADGTVTLSGRDKAGRSWTARYQAFPGAGCQLWQARLERSTEPALVFVQFGGNTSGGWDTTLSVLLFDAQSRPFPWQAKGKFDVTEEGIRELVILGKTNAPAVLVHTQQSDGPGNHHKSNSLYTFLGNRAVEATGELEGRHWPFTTSSSSREWPELPASHTLNTASALSNTDASDAARFEGVRGANDSNRQVILSSGAVYFPDVLVVDTQSGRKIVSFPEQSDLAGLEVGKATGVALGNNCGDGDCHPVVVWLRQ
ncbi:MAG TPA: hypothetical protein VF392_16915 [Terracidiphilus sp.]